MPMKRFEDLTLADNFIFFKVMQEPDICRRLLEVILNVEIDHIEYLEGEKTFDARYEAKSIRLDVYVKDGKGTVYNVEMQAEDAANLPQRSRYYQSMIDVGLIEKGEDYEKLNQSFVIFICLSDIFHKGRHIYTFENRCVEDTGIALGDGTRKIFLNPSADREDVTPELANFLQYLTDGKASDEFTERLVEAVDTAKKNPKLRVEYMSYYANRRDLYLKAHDKGVEEGKNEGIAIGKAEGLEEGIRALIETSRELGSPYGETLRRAVQKFHLTEETAEAYMQKYWISSQPL